MESIRLITAIRKNISQAVIGNDYATRLVLAALFCRGHVLLEDVPGIGKTTLVTALAKTLGCTFRRIQFTPDVMPSDITGFMSPDPNTGEMQYHAGSIMSQIVLADEINRTSPKTQSSLLEAMQETQVTVDGSTYPLPDPFMVLATQNPVEYVGTYPLPEAQLDRFLVKIALGYPSLEQEMTILEKYGGISPLTTLEPVADAKTVKKMQKQVDQVFCSEPIREYIALLAASTRSHEDVMLGISPRGALSLMRSAKAWAFMEDRTYVVPEDVHQMIFPVFIHRLILHAESRLKKRTPKGILDTILRSVTIPGAL